MKEAFYLQNKTALVTGGGTGIGFGVTKTFIEQGCKVIITGRRIKVLEKASGNLGENCHYLEHDINKLDSIPVLIDQLEKGFGPIDILVNNAGMHLKKPFKDTSDGEFLDVLKTNLLGVFAMSREFGKRMMDRGSGNIILIASMASIMGIDKVVAYSASKTALLGIMRTMMVEMAPFNVRINAIAPGWIESEMLHKALDQDPARKEKIMARIPMSKFGQPEDIGHAAVYLASEASKYVTGVLLPIDGGAAHAL